MLNFHYFLDKNEVLIRYVSMINTFARISSYC